MYGMRPRKSWKEKFAFTTEGSARNLHYKILCLFFCLTPLSYFFALLWFYFAEKLFRPNFKIKFFSLWKKKKKKKKTLILGYEIICCKTATICKESFNTRSETIRWSFRSSKPRHFRSYLVTLYKTPTKKVERLLFGLFLVRNEPIRFYFVIS